MTGQDPHQNPRHRDEKDTREEEPGTGPDGTEVGKEAGTESGGTGGPVTRLVSRTPRPGREDEFGRFVEGIVEETSRFPGHRGAQIFRPHGNDTEWRVMFAFDTEEDLRRWEASEQRRRWYEAGEELALEEPAFSDVTGTSQERPLARALIPFDRFVRTSVSGTALLLVGTALALLFANSPLAGLYSDFFEAELTIGTEAFGLTEPIREWINEALMAFFFFLVGLEIKRELLVGELSTVRKASLPAIAALGGMLVPAGIYLAFNSGLVSNGVSEGVDGWGIPMATDIAFALAVLYLLGDRVPSNLRTFLAALAIADDVGAVLVIAIFYTAEIHLTALLIAAGLVAVLAIAGRGGTNYPLFYAGGGILVWLAVFESGVHATIAGVLVAATVPARSWINASEFLSRSRQALEEFEDSFDEGDSVLSNARQQAAIEQMRKTGQQAETPMQNLQNHLDRWVAFVVLPVFALANAGLVLSGLIETFTSRAALSAASGIFFGLLVGKPIGITLFTYLAVKLGVSDLPAGVRWPHVAGVGLLGGIGFTVSLFITGLAFGEGSLLAEAARVGIFAGSLVAGTAGLSVLLFFDSKDRSNTG